MRTELLGGLSGRRSGEPRCGVVMLLPAEVRSGSAYRPMREPVFNETLQLGIVVRDLEATMRRYVDDYGIGPWEVHEFNAGNAEDFREYGQPVERSWRVPSPRSARCSGS